MGEFIEEGWAKELGTWREGREREERERDILTKWHNQRENDTQNKQENGLNQNRTGEGERQGQQGLSQKQIQHEIENAQPCLQPIVTGNYAISIP
jgi:hypothetical protein